MCVLAARTPRFATAHVHDILAAWHRCGHSARAIVAHLQAAFPCLATEPRARFDAVRVDAAHLVSPAARHQPGLQSDSQAPQHPSRVRARQLNLVQQAASGRRDAARVMPCLIAGLDPYFEMKLNDIKPLISQRCLASCCGHA